MSVSILFFGAVANEVGVRSKQVELADEKSAAALFERVISDHPSLRRHKLLFAVNQAYVSGDVLLQDGDELAIFTAVSGG